MDSSGSGQEPVMDSCEHGNETVDSIKGVRFCDKLSYYQFIKDSSPRSYLDYKHTSKFYDIFWCVLKINKCGDISNQ